jgi:hypothetical protein
MNLDAPIHGQIDSTIPQSLGLCVRSLAALVKQRAHERDIACLERDLAIRERDTIRAMLSVTLGLLHMAERRKGLLRATRDVIVRVGGRAYSTSAVGRSQTHLATDDSIQEAVWDESDQSDSPRRPDRPCTAYGAQAP